MEVRCAGDSPKDSSECVSGAVSVLCLFFFIMATPFKGKRPWVKKEKKKEKKKIYIYIYMYMYICGYILYTTNIIMSFYR